jgi:plastocyanin
MNQLPIRKNRVLMLVIVGILLSGCMATSESQFQLEDNYKNTVFSKNTLEAGTKITFHAENLNKHETLSLNKCGQPCNTAVFVKSFSKSDFDKSNTQSVTIESSGVYYFWVSSDIQKGKCSSIPATSLKYLKNESVVQYSSGTVIRFAIEKTGSKQ